MAPEAGSRDIIPTDPSSSFECEYPSGVNRVLSLGSCLLVDNIARNFELWQFDSATPATPARRARYDVTAYPGDAAASLLDVDVHAAFLRHGQMIVVNHYGRARWFDVSPPVHELFSTHERQLLGDTERIAIAHDCFITSSPRGEYTADPAQPGVFFFEPMPAVQFRAPESGALAPRLRHEQVLTGWEVVDAIEVSADGGLLAVASGPRIGVFDLASGDAGLRLGACRWETDTTYHCQWLHFDRTHRLWTGGHQLLAAGSDGGTLDACRGGHVCAFDVGGERAFDAELPDETAWGYGADPLVLADDERRVFVLGRDGSLHVTATSRSTTCLYGPIEAQGEPALASLGIGHAARRGDFVYAGFSRGGYQLLRYDVRGR